MTWLEKYELLLKDELISKDVMAINHINYTEVRKWRIDFIARMEDKGIKLKNNMKIPTDLFLEDIGKDLNYFKKKMQLEHEIRKIKGEMK